MTAYSAYPTPPIGPTPVSTASVRPGLVTAIGVTSIVVASLSMLAVLFYGGFVLIVRVINGYAANQAQSQIYRASSAGVVKADRVEGVPTPDELDQELAAETGRLSVRRDALADLLASMQELSSNQRTELQAMLGRHGDRFVPAGIFQAEALSAADVRKWVTKVGTLPPDSVSGAPPVFFRFTTGELTVYDDRAVFRPGDGGGNLRSAAKDGLSVDGLRSTLRPPPATRPAGTIYRSGMSDADVDQAVSAIQQSLQGTSAPLNEKQLATLRRRLQDKTPPLVSPGTEYAPTRMVTNMNGGQADLHLTGGFILITDDGRVVNEGSSSLHEVSISPVAVTFLAADVAAKAALAIFLLVIGIMTLRGSPRGAGLHWLFAMTKLCVAIFGAVTFAWVMAEYDVSFGKLNSDPSSTDGGKGYLTFAMVMGTVGAVYPIVLMFVLPSRTIREHFRMLREK